MARMLLVFIVALVNLGLGFAIAIKAGRGPWSRSARRQPAKPSAEPVRQLPAVPQVRKSIEEIAREIEVLETRFQEVLQRVTDPAKNPPATDELLSIVQESLVQAESLAVDELSVEHPEQASAGLRTLLLELQSAATELEAAIADGNGLTDPAPLVTRLLMACRQVNVVMNALLFAELPG